MICMFISLFSVASLGLILFESPEHDRIAKKPRHGASLGTRLYSLRSPSRTQEGFASQGARFPVSFALFAGSKTACTRHDDTSDYVSTQIIAEKFHDLGYDGVA